MGLTNEELVRRKLASYCNQLKKKWNQIEPGGIHHAPRAAWKRQSTAENALIPALGGVLAVVVIVAGITLFGFNSRQAPTPPAVTPLEATVHTAPTRPEPAEVRPIDTAPLAPTGEGDFCSYTDDNGVIHLVNDSGKVPPRYRSRLKIVAREDNGATHVICDRNRVLVPVKIRYRGREVETTLLMDTGASVTTINEAVASRLGIDENALEAGFSTVADGRRVRSFKLAADDLAVGTKRLPGAMISILPGSGGDGTEGLLGMDFLKEFVITSTSNAA